MSFKYSNIDSSPESFNLKNEIARYLKHWKWFAFLIVLFLGFAFFYLKYTKVVYQTSAKIKVLDEASKAFELPDDINSFFETSKVNLENEIEVLKSVNLLENVVESLNLNVTYFEEGNIKSKELWIAPFRVKSIDSIKNKIPESGKYLVTISPNGYEITDSGEKKWVINSHTIDSAHSNLPFLLDTTSNALIKRHMGKTYSVRFKSVRKSAMEIASMLSVSQVGKSSDILSLNIAGESILKSETVINEIIYQFDIDGIRDRQLISQRTIDFVDNRFISLTEELDSIENDKKYYKQKNSLSHIGLDTEYTIVRKANTSDEVSRLKTQLEIASLLKDVLDTENDYSLLPANIGLENAGINTLINDYNVVVLRYEKLSKSAGSNNPLKKRTESKLINLKSNISKSVSAFEKQTETALNNAKTISTKTNNLFSGIPKKEKILRSIERQQTIKESLYLLLLQKREEASISLAITSPSIKVVDYSITNLSPLSPNSKKIYLIALFAGLLIPILFLYIVFLLDNKLYSRDDLKSIGVETQIIGEIPIIKDSPIFKNSQDSSLLSESFRNLRTNIEHNLKKVEHDEKGKIIYVTSTVKGEGKTFSAVNLACSYSVLNKKTLLIGSDFRNPQIHTLLNINKNTEGLSNYLNDTDLNINDLLLDYNLNEAAHLKILLSGNTPPAPIELLSNSRFEKLLNQLKEEYDYIIIDTAPIASISDTVLIAPMADLTLYLLRSGYTEKKFLTVSEELIKDKKLSNVKYVLNGLKVNTLYGYKYNYGYYNDSKKSFFRKLFGM